MIKDFLTWLLLGFWLSPKMELAFDIPCIEEFGNPVMAGEPGCIPLVPIGELGMPGLSSKAGGDMR